MRAPKEIADELYYSYQCVDWDGNHDTLEQELLADVKTIQREAFNAGKLEGLRQAVDAVVMERREFEKLAQGEHNAGRHSNAALCESNVVVISDVIDVLEERIAKLTPKENAG